MSSPDNEEKVHEGEVVPGETKPTGRKTSTAIARRGQAAIATAEAAPPPRITIEDMIMKALDMDKPELIDKFTAIYEKQEAERKKTAYTAAMARAQARMIPVLNNATNTHTSSKYAKLAAINKMAVPIYGEEGLAVSFKTGAAERQGERRTIAIVSHEAGYMTTDEDFFVDLPLDDGGLRGNANKTALHAAKSTNTYSKNMLVCMVFNISTEDDASDDDGNLGKKISPQDARKQRGTVTQPRAKPSAQSGEIRPFAERPQIEPVSESGNGIDSATATGFTKAMKRAFSGYNDQAGEVAWVEFRKRFPKIERLSQVPDTPEAKKLILNWITDPEKN